jgi:YgiT-type zinc finger domain-containing protein
MYCQGEMVKGKSPFHIDRKGYHFTFDEVPAWVCQQCGEAYFEPAQVEAIQELLVLLDEKTKKLAKAA